MRVALSLCVALLMIVANPAAGGASTDAGPPLDYRQVATQLSPAAYNDIIVEGLRVPVSDGAEIYVEVTRPDPAAYPGLKVPVIMKASPYHSTMSARTGTGELPGPKDAAGASVGLTGYFPAHGYAVAMMDWRGTGHSGGCFDQLGQRDAADLKEVVEWLAARDWSNGRVGTIGLSMPGHAAGVAASQEPQGLATSVIMAGGGSMYDSQFQYGVPFLAHFASPLAVYPALTVTRYGPVESYAFTSNDPSSQYASAGCGFVEPSGLAGPGMATGQYVQWHDERDFNAELANADLPLLLFHGLDDVQTRMSAAQWFFEQREGRTTDKMWIGPWGHEAETRGDQWTFALHAWFDRHLQQRAVPTGPPVEAFFDTGDAVTATHWAAAEGAPWYLDATDMSLTPTAPQQASTAAFTATGNVDGPARLADAFVPGLQEHDDGGVEFTSAPLDDDLVLFGLPKLRLQASITGELVHLVAKTYRQRADGTRRLLDICAIQPQLRDGVDTITPVVPGEAMDLEPQCYTTAHHLDAGDRLVLRIGTGSEQHVSTLSADARITVHTGPDASVYELPVRPDAVVHPDPIAGP